MKQYLKAFGYEALYLLASIAVSAISSLIQLIGRKYDGDHSSFIFSGSNYSYNCFFYILGMAVFIGFMIAGYKFFLKKKITSEILSGIAQRIIFPIIALFFSILLFAAILFCFLLICGLNDNMIPGFMFALTMFGWPVFCFGFMIFVETLTIKEGNLS